MPHWIRLNPQELNRVDKEHVNGVEITVGMAPDDLPARVRGSYDATLGRFVIEFRYPGKAEEKRVSRQENPNSEVSLLVGAHSGRLYEIHVNVRAIGVQAIELQVLIPKVEGAIESLERAIPRQIRNYEVAKRVIDQNKNRLFATVASAI